MRVLALTLAIALAGSSSLAQDLVADRNLRVGTIIGEGDVRPADPSEDVSEQLADIVGLEVRKTLYSGRPVLMENLGPPTIVHRNEIVTMTFRSGRLGIRTEGRALSAGGRGEAIRVMNLSSKQTVRAVIRDIRQVEVLR